MKSLLILAPACTLLFFCSCKKTEPDKEKVKIAYDNGPTDSLKINQMQVIASHNSYHLKTDSVIFAFLESLSAINALPAQYNPQGIDYTHLTMEEQMSNYNVRGLEIDIYNDPLGGHFYHRLGLAIRGLPTESNIPELNNPGFKVLHIPDFDYNSTNYTFKSALTSVYNWSKAHPNHIPIFINIETKEETAAAALQGVFTLTEAIPYDASAADQMDVEIKSVFGEGLDKVITPDDVRGNYATLEAAALAKNWPTLAASRGKVVFIMQGDAESIYKAGHPSLQGRAMFVYAKPNTPEAAFVILNSSIKDKAEIMQRVEQGYIVRTRADDGTTEARTGNYSEMNAAFEGWAQIVSTDYYKADNRAGAPGWTDYHVRFPNGELARINGVSAADKQSLGLIKE